MKTVKRIVSVALAFIMVFSSFSLLATAVDLGAEPGVSFEISTKFYRENPDTGEWDIETSKAARGEEIRVRVFIETDYAVSSHGLFWIYPNDVMTFLRSYYKADGVNLTSQTRRNPMYFETQEEGAPAYDAYFTATVTQSETPGGSTATDAANQLINNGYMTAEDFEGMGWIYLVMTEFDYCTALSNDYYTYEFAFEVNDDATGVGTFKTPEASVQTAARPLAPFNLAKSYNGEGGTFSSKDINMRMFDAQYALNQDATLSVTSKVDFNAGANGTIATGKASYDCYINETLAEIGDDTADDTTDDFVVPTVTANAGYKFLGWSFDGVTYYADAALAPEGTADVKTFNDLSTIAVGYDDIALAAVYEESQTAPTTDSYTMNVYVMDTKGGYPDAPTSTETIEDVEIGTQVSAADYDAIDEGFSLDEDKSTVTPIEVATGDDDVVDVYLKRAKPAVIFYDYNGGIVTEEPQYYGAEIVLPPAPDEEGMEFTGWADDEGNILAEGATVPLAGGEYFAQYEDIYYTVTYYTDDTKSNVFAIQEGEEEGYLYGDTIRYPRDDNGDLLIPDAPAGMTFTGWSVTEDTAVTSDLEVIPVFDYVTITVTVTFLDYYGDPIDAFAIEDVQGATVKVADLPVADDMKSEEPGYEDKVIFKFMHWDDADGNEVTEDIVLTEDIELSAHYEPVDVVLTFDAGKGAFDGGDKTVEKIVEFESELTSDLLPANPERKGYDFDYWNGFEEGTLVDESYLDGMTFTAEWTARDDTPCVVEVYTENLEADKTANGEYSLYATIKDSGTTGTAIFYDNAEITGFTMQHYEDVLISGEEVAVLKVYYDRNNVKITVNGEEDEVEYGAPITPDAPPVEEYEEVTGWTANGEPVDKFPVAAEEGLVLVPVIETKSYAIVFMNGDQKITDEPQKYGEAITAPADPTAPENKKFVGWYTDLNDETTKLAADTVVPVNGATYYAKFDTITGVAYKVEVYTENLEADKVANGEWKLEKTIDGTGDAGADIPYAAEVIEGFTMQAITPVKITADGNAVLKVYYDRNTVAITVNGEEDEVEYGAPITPDAPSVEEYEEVTGWTANGEPVDKFPVAAEEGLVLEPVIETKSYAIVFMNGDQKITDEPQKYGEAITAPDDPAAPENMKFVGWYTDLNDETTKLAADTVVPVNGATYYAKFETITGVAYKVEVYTENLEADKAVNGEWKLEKTIDGTGDAGADIPYAAEVIKGFTMQTITPVKITADGNAVLKVYYDRDTVTITVNGEEDEVEYGAPITPDAPPVEEYEEVTGWTANGEPVDKFPVAAEEGLVLVPVIETKSYAIVFMNGDQKITDEPQKYGEAITAPADPTAPENKKFVGWYTDLNDETTKLAADTVVPVNGATYYAKFDTITGVAYKVEVYTENLEADKVANGEWKLEKTIDGTGDAGADIPYEAEVIEGFTMQAITPVKITADGNAVLKVYYDRNNVKITVNGEEDEVEYGAPITPDAPSLEEYEEVTGWTANGEPVDKFPVAAEEGLVLEPVIETKSYAIVFMNGDQKITDEPQKYGEVITAPADVVKPGYTFGGWYTDLNDESTKLAADTVVPVNGATYYAKLTINKWTATFVDENGAVVDTVENVAYGTELNTIAPTAPVVEGKTFSYWEDTNKNVMSTMPDSDMTYKAVYVDNNEVEYTMNIYVMDVNGEYTLKATSTARAPIGKVVSLKDDSASNIGCYLDTEKSTLSAVVTASGTVLEAYYARNYVTITFVDKDGVEVAPAAKGYYGSKVTEPVPEEREFYKFKGWTTEIPDTMPLEDLTIVAEYDRDPIRLVAADGSTTQIDTDAWLITGIAPVIRSEADYDQFLKVEGDGTYKATPVAEYKYGTGTKIELIDNYDGAVLETYYVVIYGDINGDAQINAVDSALVRDEAYEISEWSVEGSKEYNLYKLLAADINKDGLVDFTDSSIVELAAGKAVTLDQAECKVIYK